MNGGSDDDMRPIRMGVLCGCLFPLRAIPMEPQHIFNMDLMGGKGYHWQCPECGIMILVNLEELEPDFNQTKLEDFE
jgi:hypothetical protein